ncbi:uncharacterized protein N7511_006118 [Penicillium nucicola]|uniref:uncharacterized protein n=1 Tax=Penicillium nucicola TaxID=1850975 RepID=UPI002544DA18|nr:uncharacterized protein N7511_006118 [Penicillium nucicola]KAJ5757424.1 hypothetical protein N7511_006118 [Penicillium nucicola]
MGPVQTPWTSILLQKKPGLHEYNHALNNVEKYYSRLHTAMQSENVRDQLSLNPDQIHSRLLKSFEILRTKQLSGPVAEEILKVMVLSFVNDDIFSPAQVIQLVGSSLPIIPKQSLHSQYLRGVIDMLLASQGLLDHLVANEEYSTVFKTWLSPGNNLPTSILRRAGAKIISVCKACSADHGTASISESWDIAVQLETSLTSLEKSHAENSKHVSVKSLPPLETMKALTLDDKKSHSSQLNEQPKNDLLIPDETLAQLRLFDINIPISSRGMTLACEKIQTEILPQLLRCALETFPCRMCLDRLSGGLSPLDLVIPTEPQSAGSTTQLDYAQEIFGKRIGLWKVLLSDTALKSASILADKASLSAVVQALKALSSGQWSGKNLSRPMGSNKQKNALKVPVMGATANSTVSVLWQIDVGFYDELPWVQQHVIKVWQIVTSIAELENAIDQVISVQTSYSLEHTALCLVRPAKQFDGTWIPQQFQNVKGSHPKPLEPNLNTGQVLIGMSNKFYSFNEPLLNALLDGNKDAEFPFELSAQELQVVRHFSTSSLILGRSGTGKTSCLLFKMLARHLFKKFRSEEHHARQLLLTRSAYLASKLQSYAKTLIDTQMKPTSSPPGREYDQNPISFFALGREHFPVICTYDRFLDLMEMTLRMADRKDFLHGMDSNKSKYIDNQKVKSRVIDFNVFKTEYWGCLSGLAPSSCSPELLFAEIMGVIKGCSLVAKRLKVLQRTEYVSKNAKMSPAFACEADREKVYVAFERYEKQKRQREEIDELDRVTLLLKSLRNNTTIASQVQCCFEEIYVDEIQDLRCLDIVLLLGCLSDARAGDTAQCISKDSVFRFPEVKDLFFDHYEITAKKLNQPLLARPVQFSLAKNYRSHQGILSFASWVMQLLWNGFPQTIDKLEPEIGETGGPKPIVFAGFDSSILSAKMIGLVKLNDQVANFGAEQVIIVRDDLAKDRLQCQIGEIALVLTVLESKGMEFDDVLIYDFFGGSELSSSYRCLYQIAASSRIQFDPQKHAALCSELKHLYVAVTRARRQLWFMEIQEKSIDPILQALSTSGSLELAEVVKQKDPNVAEMVRVLRAGGSVDPDRWLKRALHLLDQKNFADALFCYKKAKDLPGIARSQACLYEQDARAYRAAGDFENSSICLEKAIPLFREIGFMEQVASCYEVLGQFGKVAEIWAGLGQIEKAVGFFEKGKMFYDACMCYHACADYEQAVDVLRRGEKFDELIYYFNQNCQYLSATTRVRYSRLCNILLKQGRISANLRLATINMLGNDDTKVAFFREFEMWDQLRSLFYTSRRWFEYYELSLAVGDLSVALQTLLRCGLLPTTDKQTVQLLFHYVMAEAFHCRNANSKARRIEEQTNILRAVKTTWLEPLAKQWIELQNFSEEFSDPDASMSIKKLPNGVLKDFLCLYAVTFEFTIFVRSNGSLLPMDMLSRVCKLMQEFEEQINAYPSCLALVFGIFADPKQDTDMLKYARRVTQDKFCAALSFFHETASVHMKIDHPVPCNNQVFKGYCSRTAEDCSFSHERISDEMICVKFKYLLAVADVFAKITPLYRGRYLTEEWSKQFLGRRRHWVQRVQDELLIVGSIDQSALAIAQLRCTLYNDPDFMVTAYCLEDLLYYRMQNEWRSYCTLTSFLDKVQQAQTLGPQTGQRFHRQLVHRIEQNISYSQRSMEESRTLPHPLAVPLAGLKAAERIRIAIDKRASDFPAAVQVFLQCLEKSIVSSLTHFHTILSVLELSATYVLAMSSPDSAIAVPWSWALLHLPTVMLSSSKSEIKERSKRVYSQLLILIVFTLCKTVSRLEATIKENPLHFLQGKGSCDITPVVMRRRYIDFLTTILLNFQNWPSPPKGLKEMSTLIHKTVKANLPTNMHLVFYSHDAFKQTCIREYEMYNEKDMICVVSLENKDTPPLFLKTMVQNNAKYCKLDDILRASHAVEQNSGLADQAGETPSIEEYTGYELDRIVNLQRCWRKVMSVFQINRCFRESPEGKLCQQVHELTCKALPMELHTLDRIRIRKVLFTDCIKVICEMEVQLAALQQLTNKWRRHFNNCPSTSNLEALSTLRGEIILVGNMLQVVNKSWSLKGLEKVLGSVNDTVLAASARDSQRALLAIQYDIGNLIDKIDDVASS